MLTLCFLYVPAHQPFQRHANPCTHTQNKYRLSLKWFISDDNMASSSFSMFLSVTGTLCSVAWSVRPWCRACFVKRATVNSFGFQLHFCVLRVYASDLWIYHRIPRSRAKPRSSRLLNQHFPSILLSVPVKCSFLAPPPHISTPGERCLRWRFPPCAVCVRWGIFWQPVGKESLRWCQIWLLWGLWMLTLRSTGVLLFLFVFFFFFFELETFLQRSTLIFQGFKFKVFWRSFTVCETGWIEYDRK